MAFVAADFQKLQTLRNQVVEAGASERLRSSGRFFSPQPGHLSGMFLRRPACGGGRGAVELGHVQVCFQVGDVELFGCQSDKAGM